MEFHCSVSQVALQLCDILVVMKTANNSLPSSIVAKWSCCNVIVSEFPLS